MLKTLYEHFIVLYESLLSKNPTLASEHALRQEEEVYKKSTKLTYRNVYHLIPQSITWASPSLLQLGRYFVNSISEAPAKTRFTRASFGWHGSRDSSSRGDSQEDGSTSPQSCTSRALCSGFARIKRLGLHRWDPVRTWRWPSEWRRFYKEMWSV